MALYDRFIKQGGYGRCSCILNTGEKSDLINLILYLSCKTATANVVELLVAQVGVASV